MQDIKSQFVKCEHGLTTCDTCGLTTCPQCGGPALKWADPEDESDGAAYGPRFLDCQDHDGCGFTDVLW